MGIKIQEVEKNHWTVLLEDAVVGYIVLNTSWFSRNRGKYEARSVIRAIKGSPFGINTDTYDEAVDWMVEFFDSVAAAIKE